MVEGISGKIRPKKGVSNGARPAGVHKIVLPHHDVILATGAHVGVAQWNRAPHLLEDTLCGPRSWFLNVPREVALAKRVICNPQSNPIDMNLARLSLSRDYFHKGDKVGGFALADEAKNGFREILDMDDTGLSLVLPQGKRGSEMLEKARKTALIALTEVYGLLATGCYIYGQWALAAEHFTGQIECLEKETNSGADEKTKERLAHEIAWEYYWRAAARLEGDNVTEGIKDLGVANDMVSRLSPDFSLNTLVVYRLLELTADQKIAIGEIFSENWEVCFSQLLAQGLTPQGKILVRLQRARVLNLVSRKEEALAAAAELAPRIAALPDKYFVQWAVLFEKTCNLDRGRSSMPCLNVLITEKGRMPAGSVLMAYAARGSQYFQSGKFEHAAADLRQARRMLDANAGVPWGKIYFLSAMALCRCLPEGEITDPKCHERKLADEALEVIGALLERGSDDAEKIRDLRIRRAEICVKIGEIDAAVRELDLVFFSKGLPEDLRIEVLIQRGIAFLMKDLAQAADYDFTLILGSPFDHPQIKTRAAYNRGIAQLMMKDFTAALADFDRALQAPDDVFGEKFKVITEKNRAVALFHLGRVEEAFALWEKHTAVQPFDRKKNPIFGGRGRSPALDEIFAPFGEELERREKEKEQKKKAVLSRDEIDELHQMIAAAIGYLDMLREKYKHKQSKLEFLAKLGERLDALEEDIADNQPIGKISDELGKIENLIEIQVDKV